MYQKFSISILIVAIAFTLAACGGGADSQKQDNSTTGLEWPSQYMSNLPAPDSKITSIDKLNGTEPIAENDTSTQPSSVNVCMNDMSKEEALAYYDKLKNAGFTINSDEKDKEKILLVGTLNDADHNPFLFGYDFQEHFGNVNITIIKEILAP